MASFLEADPLRRQKLIEPGRGPFEQLLVDLVVCKNDATGATTPAKNTTKQNYSPPPDTTNHKQETIGENLLRSVSTEDYALFERKTEKRTVASVEDSDAATNGKLGPRRSFHNKFSASYLETLLLFSQFILRETEEQELLQPAVMRTPLQGGPTIPRTVLLGTAQDGGPPRTSPRTGFSSSSEKSPSDEEDDPARAAQKQGARARVRAALALNMLVLCLTDARVGGLSDVSEEVDFNKAARGSSSPRPPQAKSLLLLNSLVVAGLILELVSATLDVALERKKELLTAFTGTNGTNPKNISREDLSVSTSSTTATRTSTTSSSSVTSRGTRNSSNKSASLAMISCIAHGRDVANLLTSLVLATTSAANDLLLHVRGLLRLHTVVGMKTEEQLGLLQELYKPEAERHYYALERRDSEISDSSEDSGEDFPLPPGSRFPKTPRGGNCLGRFGGGGGFGEEELEEEDFSWLDEEEDGFEVNYSPSRWGEGF